MTSANALSVAPVEGGWAVMLTDGRELARFSGPAAKRDALRYVANVNPIRRHPPIDLVRRVHHESTRRWGPPNPS
jgi:hypothetical protein